jgi:nucleoside-diphosphate-sugar epimerase
MTYLVLGSAGQVGAALVTYLGGLGHRVLGLDIVNSPEEDLRAAGNRKLDQFLQESDFAFFLAFDVGGALYLKKYQQTYDFVSNNMRIMNETFEALRKRSTPFLFASSQMSNMTHSSYGALKAVGEHYTHILGGLIVKFWNVYGIECDPEKTHVITDFIRKARDNRLIDMMTDGTEERQFLYSEDCSEALHVLSGRYRDIPRDRELHVTSYQWTNILRVADIIASHFPGTRVVPGQSEDKVQLKKRNEPDPYVRAYWSPKTSLEEGIARLIAHDATDRAKG